MTDVDNPTGQMPLFTRKLPVRPPRLLTLALGLWIALPGAASRSLAEPHALAVTTGLTVPIQGDGPREDIGYGALFKQGVSFSAQYRYLLFPHLSVMVEGAHANLPIVSEEYLKLVSAGELKVKGGDLVQTRYSGGLAYESNTLDKPNLVVKILASWYRTTPNDVVVTSDQGVLQTEKFTTIQDFGINAGFALEIPVSNMLAVHAGADADLIPSSDLFSADGKSRLINTTARAGFVLWF